ncbi:hypothetical protein D3C85_1243620 [compost metagenome]
MLANSSAARCWEVPLPDEPKLIDPGLALAAASTSCTDLYGLFTFTTSTLGSVPISATGWKFLTGSYGILGYRLTLMACELMVPPSSV